MTDMQAWLDQGKALADQAGEGPWLYYNYDILGPQELQEDGLYSELAYHAMDPNDADGEFIADARSRLPQALDALQAVLDLHKPIEFVGHSATWLHCTQGCATYPCPTVEAIQRALTTPNYLEENDTLDPPM